MVPPFDEAVPRHGPFTGGVRPAHRLASLTGASGRVAIGGGPMSTTVLHVSDSKLSSPQTGGAQDDGLGGLASAVERAREYSVDAVVHTGNLFEETDPPSELVDAVADTLGALDRANIPVYLVRGPMDLDNAGVEQLLESGVLEGLSASPTLIDDVALYGVDHTGDESQLESALADLEPTTRFTSNLLCLNERIWPPLWEDTAVVSGYDIVDGTEVFLSEVLAGGAFSSQVWESDHFEYRVGYAGSSNPRHLGAGETPVGRLITVDDASARHRDVPLTTSDIEDELAQLREVLGYHPADANEADLPTLVDLYGLTARAKNLFESRRSELRERLLEQVGEDQAVTGGLAEVQRRTRTRRRLKDAETVFDILDRHGVDRSAALDLDASKVADLVEDGTIPAEAVFDEEDHPVVRVNQLGI